MERVYQEVKTPYKYCMVVVPQDNGKKIDCPTVYRVGKDWFMSYIVFDGKGYETHLAKSKDLLQWTSLGKLLSFPKDSSRWDAQQRAGVYGITKPPMGRLLCLKKYDGKYWMTYIGGKDKGYEAGELSIGVANSQASPNTVHEWNVLDAPVLKSNDPDARWWENKKEYKSSIVWDKKQSLGAPFVMFCNANGDSSNGNKKIRWFERIGMALAGL